MAVSGGTLLAAGGSSDQGGGAGVGGGGGLVSGGCFGVTVAVTGGALIASGGNATSNTGGGGAGVGSGGGRLVGAGATVTVQAGSLTATGGDGLAAGPLSGGGGAGVGGGGGGVGTNGVRPGQPDVSVTSGYNGGSGGAVTISGGSLTATGGTMSAAVGGGGAGVVFGGAPEDGPGTGGNGGTVLFLAKAPDTPPTFPSGGPGAWTGQAPVVTSTPTAPYAWSGSSTASPPYVTVSVPAVPATPAAPIATPSNTQVALAWSAPDDGGLAIIGYQIQYRPSASATWLDAAPAPSGTGTTYTVTGLSNGTSYSFRLAATNSRGSSTWSGAAYATPMAVAPDAPTGLSADAGNTQIALAWSAPGDDGGSAITGYRVQYKPSASATWLDVAPAPSGTGTTYTVTGLSKGTSYDFQVAATNGVGSSAWSAVATAVAGLKRITGSTVPAAGTGGEATASFTTADGGSTCSFDPAATGFVAAPAGLDMPQGAFRFRLMDCAPGFTARITITWPAPVGGRYIKWGKATAAATADMMFAPTQLSINGNTVSFDVKDGALGDDDWAADGQITDPSGPFGDPQAISGVPGLGDLALALLGLGLAGLGARQLGRKKAVGAGRPAP